jgi:TetR/AcrR family transcriptional regulator, regulator of biofilm formation and stress response
MARAAQRRDDEVVDRREALIDATIRVVAERGLRGFTYRAVAAEAGVTHGLVQHYFGTLESLLEEALTVSFERDRAEAPPDMSHGLDEVVAHLPAHIDATRAQQAFQYEILIESLRREELAPHLRRLYTDYVGAMRQRLVRAGLPDDPALARAVFAAVDGLVLQRLFFADREEMEESLEWMRRLLTAFAHA